jgi:hypothetical protein
MGNAGVGTLYIAGMWSSYVYNVPALFASRFDSFTLQGFNVLFTYSGMHRTELYCTFVLHRTELYCTFVPHAQTLNCICNTSAACDIRCTYVPHNIELRVASSNVLVSACGSTHGQAEPVSSHYEFIVEIGWSMNSRSTD